MLLAVLEPVGIKLLADSQILGLLLLVLIEHPVEATHAFLKAVPTIERKLHTLFDVGLSYSKLGQSATTLSGGEA